MRYYYLIQLLLLFTIPCTTRGQMDLSNYQSIGRPGIATTSATDYHAININPANLGLPLEYENKRVTLGLLENNFAFYTGNFSRTQTIKALSSFSADALKIDQKTIKQNTRDEVVRQFSSASTGFNLNTMGAGLSVQIPHQAGIGFSVNMRSQFYSGFGNRISDLLLFGSTSRIFDRYVLNSDTINYLPSSNDSLEQINEGILDQKMTVGELLDGTRVSLSSYIEYNTSFGTQLLDTDLWEIYGGIGLKYIQGIAVMDFLAVDGEIKQAYAGFSTHGMADDFGINTSGIENQGEFGKGFGMDLGFNIRFKRKYNLGVSVSNLGRITWKGNVYEFRDSVISDIDGSEIQTGSSFEYLEAFFNSVDLLRTEKVKKKITKLPTLFRIGLTREIEHYARIGGEIIIPGNSVAGNLNQPVYTMGFELMPEHWLRLSSGLNMTANASRYDIPLGITFIAGETGTWESGITTRDISTLFINNTPTISMGIGFLRFRI